MIEAVCVLLVVTILWTVNCALTRLVPNAGYPTPLPRFDDPPLKAADPKPQDQGKSPLIGSWLVEPGPVLVMVCATAKHEAVIQGLFSHPLASRTVVPEGRSAGSVDPPRFSEAVMDP